MARGLDQADCQEVARMVSKFESADTIISFIRSNVSYRLYDPSANRYLVKYLRDAGYITAAECLDRYLSG